MFCGRKQKIVRPVPCSSSFAKNPPQAPRAAMGNLAALWRAAGFWRIQAYFKIKADIPSSRPLASDAEPEPFFGVQLFYSLQPMGGSLYPPFTASQPVPSPATVLQNQTGSLYGFSGANHFPPDEYTVLYQIPPQEVSSHAYDRNRSGGPSG